MVIALYLRLSEADGDLGPDGKDESNSIENQRLLLHNYVDANDELSGEIVEFVDDGYSGTNFDRPGFKRMIEEAKKGRIQVIIVKDLSRLGRDYITAGDYIEQIFPMLQVRFIAANNGYDSAKNRSGNAGFDVAISNLVNTFYSRDLSKKMKAANRIRWKNGISTAGHAPFGYLRSPTEKGKYVIDPEAAQIVRFIFDKALEKNSVAEISRLLNEKQAPTPWFYNLTRRNWKMSDPVTLEKERIWDSAKVSLILKRYEYTGALVMGRSLSLAVGTKRRKLQPKSEWTIVENVNEPIVTREEYELANNVFQARKQPDYIIGPSYPLKGKVRCGNCHRALTYSVSTYKEYFICRHGIEQDRFSDCCTEQYPTAQIEAAVWRSLKELISTLECLGSRASIKAKEEMKKAKSNQRSAEAELEKINAEKIQQYEMYADGVITKELYIRRKQELTKVYVDLKNRSKESSEQYDYQNDLWDSAKKLESLSKQFSGEEKLTRKMVLAFIKCVYIYDPNRIEIVYEFEDEIFKLKDLLVNENCE